MRYNHVHDVIPGTNGKEVGIDVEAEHLYDIEVYRNIVHDIPAMGFALACEAGGTLENIRLYNNIAYNGRSGWGGGIGIENVQLQNMIIRNNISSQNTYGQMTADPVILSQIHADHNLTDGDRDAEFEFYGAND